MFLRELQSAEIAVDIPEAFKILVREIADHLNKEYWFASNSSNQEWSHRVTHANKLSSTFMCVDYIRIVTKVYSRLGVMRIDYICIYRTKRNFAPVSCLCGLIVFPSGKRCGVINGVASRNDKKLPERFNWKHVCTWTCTPVIGTLCKSNLYPPFGDLISRSVSMYAITHYLCCKFEQCSQPNSGIRCFEKNIYTKKKYT